MKSKFEIGDWVYSVDFIKTQDDIPCPICFGNKEVMLTLGDGTEMMLDCDFCGHGLSGPRGVIKGNWYESYKITPVCIISVEFKPDGEVRYGYTQDGEYHGSCRIGYEKNLFSDDGAARAYAHERIAELNAELVEEDAAKFKHKATKSYAWNAGYWMREAKEHEAAAVRARNHYRIMKSKSGDE